MKMMNFASLKTEEKQENPSNELERQTIKKPEDEKTKSIKGSAQSIRIGMDQLDTFMNLIGELVISKGRLAQIAADNGIDDLSETVSTFDRLATELQDKITTIRMIPMNHVFDRFPRMVRDLAKSNGKKINLLIEGGDIELDRTVLDKIGDPLVHLLRNSVDHGIESPEDRKTKGKPEEGTVELIAERTRNNVLIKVRDDGKGIDPVTMKKAAVKKGLRSQQQVDKLDNKEAIDLLWLPGLSTAEKITNVSGRGVVMYVVKSTIEQLNGSIELSSEIDKGSTFSLLLPLTMAIFKALFVGVGEETYAIPISNVSETVSLSNEDVNFIRGQMTTVLRDNVLPLISLSDVLEIEKNSEELKSTMCAVIAQKENKQIGLIVDRLIGEQEITIKNIGSSLGKTKGIAGVTITGDGRVILVIDINTLID
jgi:two-component system chemotaxis sensor kinase CheA